MVLYNRIAGPGQPGGRYGAPVAIALDLTAAGFSRVSRCGAPWPTVFDSPRSSCVAGWLAVSLPGWTFRH